LAVVNGPEARSLRLPLSFLGSGPWQALLVRDDPQRPDAVRIEKAVVRPADSLSLELAPGGGFLARLGK